MARKGFPTVPGARPPSASAFAGPTVLKLPSEVSTVSDATRAIRPADGDALDYVERLLSRADLPTDDVRSGPGRFYVAAADGERVGVGGLEAHDDVGLLRSVVVEPSRRGEGYGAAIAERLEGEARSMDVDALHLLTTTAVDFFAAQGYDAIDRDAVPPAIRETTQFSELCPDSAVVMRKEL